MIKYSLILFREENRRNLARRVQCEETEIVCENFEGNRRRLKIEGCEIKTRKIGCKNELQRDRGFEM